MLYIIAVIINIALSVIEYSVIIECVCSFLPQVSQTRFYEVISKFNAPFLNPLRRAADKIITGLPVDISPLLLVVIIGIIRRFI